MLASGPEGTGVGLQRSAGVGTGQGAYPLRGDGVRS